MLFDSLSQRRLPYGLLTPSLRVTLRVTLRVEPQKTPMNTRVLTGLRVVQPPRTQPPADPTARRPKPSLPEGALRPPRLATAGNLDPEHPRRGRFRAPLACACLLLSAAAGAASTVNWPQFRGP